MLCVGVTGGIGSGKSTVCRVFASLGIPVYYSDTSAKRLISSDPVIRENIISAFGPGSFGEDGSLNRTYLASRVFADPNELEVLDRIVHPAVGADFVRWAAQQHKWRHPYVILESAILFESGFDRYTDHNITVSAPVQLRIERVTARDRVDAVHVRQRMARQMGDAEREARADAVLLNDGSCPLLDKILELHERLLTGVGGDSDLLGHGPQPGARC